MAAAGEHPNRETAKRLVASMAADLKVRCNLSDPQQAAQIEALELAMPGFIEFVLTSREAWNAADDGNTAMANTLASLFAAMLGNALRQIEAPPGRKQHLAEVILNVAARRVALAADGGSIRSEAVETIETGEVRLVRSEAGHG